MTESWQEWALIAVSLLGVVLAWLGRRRSKARRERAGIIGWSALLWVCSLYSAFLLLRLIDMGTSEYMVGTVTSKGYVNRPSSGVVNDRTGVVVSVLTVAVEGGTETLEVYGASGRPGEPVCVRRRVGKWSKGVVMEIVNMDECTLRLPALERKLEQQQQLQRGVLESFSRTSRQ